MILFSIIAFVLYFGSSLAPPPENAGMYELIVSSTKANTTQYRYPVIRDCALGANVASRRPNLKFV